MNEMISITELTRMFNITTRTIRYYEEIGLMECPVRSNGIRHYEKDAVVKRINEILFLKSLGFKLSDIRFILNNSLYIKPILMNIRLSLIYKQIEKLRAESLHLKQKLANYNWQEIIINNESILRDMEKSYSDLLLIEEQITSREQVTKKDAVLFVEYYKKWHEEMGMTMSEEHLRLLAFNPEIQIRCEKVKELFIKYFE
ncbi:MerR family transcriptional regulator [Enterococcus sp. UD-01]|uniref:MerR family transcriptional regulator n=1 Tax=Enterococcus sp. UD-01 TaxID=3373911 RepID=UPI003850DF60